MKWLYHIVVIGGFGLLVYFLYNQGLGAIPFSLAALYFGVWSLLEYRKLKKEKR